MTRADAAAAAVTVAALAGVAAWSLRSGGGSGGAGLRTEIELDAGNPACPRHGLYRRFDGHAARDALTQPGGWAWFATPPASEVI